MCYSASMFVFAALIEQQLCVMAVIFIGLWGQV